MEGLLKKLKEKEKTKQLKEEEKAKITFFVLEFSTEKYSNLYHLISIAYH